MPQITENPQKVWFNQIKVAPLHAKDKVQGDCSYTLWMIVTSGSTQSLRQDCKSFSESFAASDTVSISCSAGETSGRTSSSSRL